MAFPERVPVRIVDAGSLHALERRYLTEYPQAMRVLELGGVYPGRHQIIENPYTSELHTEYFGNVGDHNLTVAYAAEMIASAIPGLTSGQRHSIVERALIHDATKRYEVMRRDLAKERSGGLSTSDAYTPAAYDTIRPILDAQGIPQTMIEYMANAGSETGKNSLPHFVLLNPYGILMLNPDRTIEEQIVHLADDMTSTPIVGAGERAQSKYLTFSERAIDCDFPSRYAFSYKEGFGFDPQGKSTEVKDISQISNMREVRSYIGWHEWVAGAVAANLLT